MKVTVELTDVQVNALATVGVDTTKQTTEFAAAALNNKLKGSIMSALKRVVVDGEAQYKALSAHMQLPLTSAEFIAKASQNYYNIARELGGRTMKPLDEIVRGILAGDSAIEE